MNKKLYKNGKIHIMDKKRSIVDSIYIEEDKIKDFGEFKYLNEKYDIKNSDIIDLKGKTTIPGFNDSHMHILKYGESLESVDLRGVKSVEEIIQRCKDFLSKNELREEQWLVGTGWNQDLFSKNEFPNKNDLDKISTEIPIALSRVCTHITVCNSKAIEIMGINEKTKVEGGEVERDEDGNLTGMFKENANSFINKAKPELTLDDIKDILQKATKSLEKYGLTSIQSDDLQHGGKSWETVIQAYKELYNEEKINIRINQQSLFFDIKEYLDFIEKGIYKLKINNKFKVGPLKLLGDGSLGARTAYLNKPYSDDPTKVGMTAYTTEQLDEFVLTACKNDMPVAIHSIGDKMMDMAFDSIEKANKETGKELRHGIVHCQITTKELFDRFKENNVSAYIQPIFASTDWEVAPKRIGNERAKYTYNWKRYYDLDIIASFGTDSPVESPNPLENIYSAVTRKDFRGNPENGWLPEQKLTVDQSVVGYTYNSAYMSYEENIKGTLEKGKLADMVVLSQDIFDIEPEKIKDVKVEMTIIGGKEVCEQ
ncbi:MAG: amidohydrolase family protein [Bacillota bacterium]|nr:amidohydrolase family protein [Bacillota bacterium]